MKKLVIALLLFCGLAQTSLEAVNFQGSTLATGAAILSAAAFCSIAYHAYGEAITDSWNNFLRRLEEAREDTAKKALVVSGTATLLFAMMAWSNPS